MSRVGIGHDIHRLAEGRRLVLGGVDVPYERGLLGHSDADVVLHALCDAMLGAAGLPDIGELFPDTDPQWKNADSRRMVEIVLAKVRERRFAPQNVDLMILAQAPRLGPLKQTIRESIGKLLEIPDDSVGVKAGTNEGFDAVGRGEAIACTAVVLLRDIHE